MMPINLENLVPISEANQNFSKVSRMVDANETAVILKNNQPKYVLMDYGTLVKEEKRESTIPEQETVDAVVSEILSRHLDAFKELAK